MLKQSEHLPEEFKGLLLSASELLMSIGLTVNPLTLSFSSAVEICSGRGAVVVFALLNVWFVRIVGLKYALSIFQF